MKQPSAKTIDRHDAPEIFCDGALAITLRNDVVRITLHSDHIDAADGKTLNQVVIGRLSIPQAGFVDLYNQMAEGMKRLEKSGRVKAVEKAASQPA